MGAQQLQSVDEALARILAAAAPVGAREIVPLAAAEGRVLAASIHSPIDVPPVANSAMDGYALRFEERHLRLPVSQRIPAGAVPAPLQPATAARIFTGAPLPPGADTVVMQEEAVLEDGVVRLADGVQIDCGEHVRPAGQDIALGAEVLTAGRRLLPQDIGLLASIGLAQVSVWRRLRVAVLATGDELALPGQPLAPGQIYSSNSAMLAAMLQRLGCEVVDGGIVGDDFSATCERLQTLSAQADVVISSGGVSVGEEDHVKRAVTELGQLTLWKLNIKPGKPLAFGRVGQAFFFGLPGNPSSAFVTFCLLARPFLRRCMGEMAGEPLRLTVRAGFAWSKAGSRQEYLRAKVEWVDAVLQARLYANQSSGVLASTSWANALLVLPPATTVVAGDPVEVLMLSELLN